MVETITAAEFRDRLVADDPLHLVDTRPAESYDGWRIPGAINYLYKPDFEFDLEAFRKETDLSESDPIAVICAKGKSSNALASELDNAGFEDVTLVSDGMEGWSAVYEIAPIDLGEAHVVQVQRRAKGCLGYVIGCPETGEAAVVDATRHADEFEAVLDDAGYELVAVFDTHVHADHVSGGRRLAERFDVPYYLGSAADERMDRPFEPLAANEVVEVGTVSIKTLATPGHTSDAVSYLIDDDAVLTGDTLFVGSVGRTELQFAAAGDDSTAAARHGADALYDSLQRTLLALPDRIDVLPGHAAVADSGEWTDGTPGEPIRRSIGDLRRELPILTLDRDAFVDRITGRLPERPPNYETIVGLNAGQTRIDDEQALIELELGPNRCAADG